MTGIGTTRNILNHPPISARNTLFRVFL